MFNKNLYFVKPMFLGVLVFASAFATGCGSRCEKAQKEIIEPVNNVASFLQAGTTGQELAQGACDNILSNLNGLPAGADLIREIARDRYTNSYAVCTRYATGFRLVCNRWFMSDDEADLAEQGDVEIEEYASEDAFDTIDLSALSSDSSFEFVMNTRNPPARRVGPGTPGPRPGPRPAPPVRVVRPRPAPPVVRPIPRYPPPVRPVPRPVCRQVLYTYCAHYEYRHERNDPMFNQAMDLAADLDRLYFKSNEMCGLAYASKYSEAEQKASEIVLDLNSKIIPNGNVFYTNACRR